MQRIVMCQETMKKLSAKQYLSKHTIRDVASPSQIVSDNHTYPADSGVFVVGYASPNVSGLAGHSNLQTRGGETVEVKGKNFGVPMNRNVSIRRAGQMGLLCTGRTVQSNRIH